MGGAKDDLDRSARLFQEASERLLRLNHAECWAPLGTCVELCLFAGDEELAAELTDRIADLGTQFDLPHVIGASLLLRSYLMICRGEPDTAERYLAAADEALGSVSRFDRNAALLVPGFVALLRGNLDDAEQLGSGAITIARTTRHPDAFYRGLTLVALIHLHRGDAGAAHPYLIEALDEATRLHVRMAQRFVLGPLAATWVTAPTNGAVLLGAVEANNHRDSRMLMFPIARAVEQAKAALEAPLSAGEYREARDRGAAMTVDDAVAFALHAAEHGR
jgi:hypothetical protein